MSVVVIWESKFTSEDAGAGLDLTRAIWRDMRAFDGYVGHELLVDDDEPGHLLVISRWTSREHANASLRTYASHPNVAQVNQLVCEPRRRIVAVVTDRGLPDSEP